MLRPPQLVQTDVVRIWGGRRAGNDPGVYFYELHVDGVFADRRKIVRLR